MAVTSVEAPRVVATTDGSAPLLKHMAVNAALSPQDFAALDSNGAPVIYAEASTVFIYGIPINQATGSAVLSASSGVEPVSGDTITQQFLGSPVALDSRGPGINVAGGSSSGNNYGAPPSANKNLQLFNVLRSVDIVEIDSDQQSAGTFYAGLKVFVVGTTGIMVAKTASANSSTAYAVVEKVIRECSATKNGRVRVRFADTSLFPGG